MNKAFKYRIYPNKEQEILISKTFGCCRFIYNKMLSDKKDYYENTKKCLNNTPAQYKGEFDWLKEVDSQALCNEQINLQKAFKNFFIHIGEVGYPKFKSKKRDRNSYITNNINNFIRIENSKIRLPKLGLVKFDNHRDIPNGYVIKSATISKTGSGKYYISILTEYEYEIPNIELDADKSIGLDYSSPKFYVDSNGYSPLQEHYYREYEDKLAKEQRKLSHMQKGSKNYYKQKVNVCKIHELIANKRKDFIEKLSTQLAREYDIVCVEDIDLQNMSQCLSLGKSTMDNGFGMFRARLQQKLEIQGKKLVVIDKWFPSSKTCRFCGCVNERLTLSDRVWTCDCGQVIDRDLNAAINIRDEGLRMLNVSI